METRQTDEFLTIKEAARVLKVSPVTISRWLKQGRLRAFHIGPRSIRIRRQDLEGLIQETSGLESGSRDEPQSVTLQSLSLSEVAKLREALERAEAVRRSMVHERGGKLLPSSADLIAREREERSIDS